MKKSLYYFIFLITQLILFVACNTAQKDADIDKISKTEDSIQNNFVGKWGGLGEALPVWDIRKDSIYYYQYSKAYAYKIINKNMVINFGNSVALLKNITVKNDTLFFIDDVGLLIKGYRFK